MQTTLSNGRAIIINEQGARVVDGKFVTDAEHAEMMEAELAYVLSLRAARRAA